MRRIQDIVVAVGDLFKSRDAGTNTPGTRIRRQWMNDAQEEVCRGIESTGEAVDTTDYDSGDGNRDQVPQMIAHYSAGGGYSFDEDGTSAANDYVLKAFNLGIRVRQAPAALFEYQKINFTPVDSNTTGAVTVDVSLLIGEGLGTTILDVKVKGGVNNPAIGDVNGGDEVKTVYRASPAPHLELINPKISVVNKNKNLLIGNFRVNQRAVTGTVILAPGEYGHDRFKGGVGGCTYIFATSNNVTTIAISAGTLIQEIEGVNIESADYVLSWQGPAQAQIDGGGFGNSGEVIATLTGGTNALVEWGIGNVSLPQLEKGTVSTEFEMRPLGEELSLCQRYYWQLQGGGNSICSIGYYNTVTAYGVIEFPSIMRSAPTLGIGSNADVQVFTNSAAITTTAITGSMSVNNAELSFTTAARTIGWGGFARLAATGTPVLTFSAEL